MIAVTDPFHEPRIHKNFPGGPEELEAYRQDVPNTQIHVLDAGHFALDTAADEVAALVRGFVGSSR